VAHGIGQQRPFEVLDSFAQGLVRSLDRIHKDSPTTITHFKLPQGEQFDHCIRLRSPGMVLDVFEYYWAPLTEGKASFAQVIGWLQMTALTPLQRLAYNIPLILVRSQGIASACLQLLREIWRIIYIPLIVLSLTGAAVYLVDNVAIFTKDITKILGDLFSSGSPSLSSFPDLATLLVFFGMVLALSALLLSVPSQIRDLFRVRNVLAEKKPNPFTGFRTNYAETAVKGTWFNRVRAAAVATNKDEEEWSIQIRARRWLAFITVVGTLFLAWTTFLVVTGRESECMATRLFTPVVHDLILKLGQIKQTSNGPSDLQRLARIVGLLALATLLKRVFIDYVGDVALYATADENSAFFKTRLAILTEATNKIRWVLRRYEHVSVAGHSLGSVIMYDAVSWLRVESQVPFQAAAPTPGTLATAPIAVDEYTRLKSIITFGSPLDKIIYFFRTKVRAYETVRAHILNELHGFRLADALLASDPTIEDFPPFQPPNNIRWLNVYSSADPISGKLVYFEGVVNYWRWYWLWGLAHLSYWHDDKFYQKVLQTIA